MTKDEKIEKLRQIINRLIYSNWNLNHEEDEAYLSYNPRRIVIRCKDTEKLSEIKAKFKKAICDIEGIEDI